MKDKSWDWATIPAEPDNRPGYTKEFSADKWNLAIRIGMDRVVTVSGGIDDPAAFIITGGWSSKWGPDPTGELLASNDAMRVNSSIAAPGITLMRRPDSTTHIRFLVALS